MQRCQGAAHPRYQLVARGCTDGFADFVRHLGAAVIGRGQCIAAALGDLPCFAVLGHLSLFEHLVQSVVDDARVLAQLFRN